MAGLAKEDKVIVGVAQGQPAAWGNPTTDGEEREPKVGSQADLGKWTYFTPDARLCRSWIRMPRDATLLQGRWNGNPSQYQNGFNTDDTCPYRAEFPDFRWTHQGCQP
jgi:hypothetical protein